MKTTRTRAALAAAASALITVAGCGVSSAHTGAPHTQPPPRFPSQCPQIIRDVNEVAGQAGINLTTGSMQYSGPTGGGDHGVKWALELMSHGPKDGVHSPSPQARQLTHNLIAAALDTVVGNTVAAEKFVASLQLVGSDCGV
jgi:hypothetical protein